MQVAAQCQAHDHIVQFYENDDFLADVVADYLHAGAQAGNRLLVILTAPHLEAITQRLKTKGVDIHSAIANGEFIALDAHITLNAIMRDGMPDETLFERHVLAGLTSSSALPRPIRAFGELVNLLCEAGNAEAAIRLEELWHDACHRSSLTLLCAYAIANFHETTDRETLDAICDHHSHVLPAENYCLLPPHLQLREVTRLQQQAQVLRHEAQCRAQAEHALNASQQLCHDMLTELANHAGHDVLTGLPNRQHAQNRLAELIANETNSESKTAVLHIDVDRLQSINDSLGLDMGDYFLHRTAQRIKRCLRQGQIVSRLGSDEMLVVLPGITRTEEIQPIVERLLIWTSEPVELAGHKVFSTCSIGISLFPDHGRTVHELIRNASLALRQAQRNGCRQYQIFIPELQRSEPDRFALRGALREAMPRGELELFYQPLICAHTRQVLAVEALPRWNSARFGSMEAQQLVHAAEESGLTASIGQWVLEKVCHQGRSWLDSGVGLKMNLNISTTQLLRDDLVDKVGDALIDSGLPGKMLEIELTENVLMSDPRRASDILHGLKGMGVRLAIDEFGSGPSALTQLHRFPVDTIKLDKTLIDGITDNTHCQAIVRSLIIMAHELGLQVVANGVETREQAIILRHKGCDILQGRLWAPLEYSGSLDEADND
ncbi:hypothetical protein L861_06160 [Litchfieldella anticariensis FP35 = DSM 16096]|uniref:Diguanylate cyclase n=1 Tax=Litchfieldella anticariensis (strain DSM 16096 / CECT 5854 / CIP 108499 / LMG 22089 / FP35) TaxID=1121939 RepID=S2L729_LITA3|nr:EAL domain-containing protein [Halomonas anticariensis]EPC00521.1 hypothetical protein L861_06160 [Halomonas anticariensis FP35 = DSM 16096]